MQPVYTCLNGAVNEKCFGLKVIFEAKQNKVMLFYLISIAGNLATEPVSDDGFLCLGEICPNMCNVY